MRYGLGESMRGVIRRLRERLVYELDGVRYVDEALREDPSLTMPPERAAWERDRARAQARAAEVRATIAWVRANEAGRWWCESCADAGYAVLVSCCQSEPHRIAWLYPKADASLRADPRSLVESNR